MQVDDNDNDDNNEDNKDDDNDKDNWQRVLYIGPRSLVQC